MDALITSTFKWLKDNPQDIVMLVVIGVLCKLLLLMMKNMTEAINRVGQQSVLLAELTTLLKSLVYNNKGKVEP